MAQTRFLMERMVSFGSRLGNVFLTILTLAVLSGSATLWSQTTYPTQIGVEVGDRPTGFIDALKDQGRLMSNSSGASVPTDANGNPLSDGIAVIFDNRPVPAWAPPIDDPAEYQPECDGNYTVSFTGQATLASVAGNPTLTFTNQTYNAATNTTTLNVYLPGGPTYADGPALMVMSFTNTQLTPTSPTNSGIANLQVIRPGFTLAQAANPSTVFDPAFVNAFAPFGYLRFMGWLGTNTNPGYFGDTGHHLLPWSSRSLPTDFYQGVGTNTSTNANINAGAWGVSWEYVILLANATNKDIWINIPMSATGSSDALDPTYIAPDPNTGYDDTSYIYNLAYLIKNGDAFTGNKGLNPGLHVYIEHSNEVWNSGFLQYTWNLLAAEDEVGQGGSVLNNDGDTNEYDWADRRHIKRLYEISQIFQTVFGAGSLNTTIRPVYAWWQLDEGSGSNAANALAWFKNTYGPPSNYFYAMAQADYFTASNYENDTTIPEVLADMSSNSSASVAYVTAGKATANQYGLQLFAYEGGPDNSNGGLQNTTNVGVQILANRDPGMDTLVQTHIRDNWFGEGGNMFGYFSLSGAYSRYGDYGATDDYRDLTTAKYNAIINLSGYEPNGVPFAPGDLVATGGNSAVGLAWQPVPGASSYKVMRGTASGGETLLATVSSSTYSDTAVTNGTTYYYEVTAANTSGTSAPSNEASATPVASTPPAPTLTATPGNDQVSLSWTAAAGATSYNVYEGTTSGGESTTPIATGVTQTTYNVTGLANGTTYYFEVAGVNTLGTGTASNETPATPVGPPAAPTNLSATIGNAQTVLTWTAVSGATSYNVYDGSTAGGESSTPIATGVTEATYTVTGLTDGTAYYFTVAAVNNAGASGYSNEASVVPALPSALLAYEPFGEAVGQIATGCCSSSTGEGNSGGDFGWNNSVWTINGNSSSTYDIASSTPLTYSGLTTTGQYLTGGSSYETIGRALDTTSGGAFASYITSTTNGNAIGAPGQTIWMSFLMQMDAGDSLNDTAGVILNPYSNCCGGLSWYDPNPSIGIGYMGSLSETNGTPYWSLQYNTNANDLGTAPVIKTNVPMVPGTPALMVVEEIFTSTGGTVNLFVNPSASTFGGTAPATPSATWTATTANALAFQGLTYYGGDNSNESAIADLRFGATYAAVTPAPAVSAPAAPTGLTATAGNGQVSLSWTASSGATSYNVYEGTASGSESTTPIATGVTSAAYSVSGLTNGTEYYFKVAAVNASGSSGLSNEASATPTPAVPAAPTGLTATAGSGSVGLTWTASAGALTYNVYEGTVSNGESATPVATGISGTSYSVSGLTNGTAYFFTVAAANAGGTSGYSNQATATPIVSGASGTLLAYEPFGEAGATPFALNGVSGGGDSGWNAGWVEQNGSTTVPGYNIASTTPLTYTGLLTTTDYAVGGDEYQGSGRPLNVSADGPFASYVSDGLIGAPGQTVWLSFLLRQDASGQTPYVGLTAQGSASSWYQNPANIQLGYFGSSSNNGATPMWSLQFNGTTVQTTAPVVTSQPALFVVSDTFGSNGSPDQISVYVNPTSLGGAAPATPTLQYSPASSTAFQGVVYYGGNGSGNSSLGDIRLGTTYAAVTPTVTLAAPPAPTSLTATAGNGQVSLTWTASAGATTYNVYEGAASGGESSTPIATGITADTYTVAGLANGTQYFFTVAAVNTGGTSGYSNETSATPSIEYANPTPITVPNYSFEADNQSNYIVPQDWLLTSAGDTGAAQQICSDAGCGLSLTGVTGTYFWSPGITNNGALPYGTETATLTTSASLGVFGSDEQYTLTVAMAAANPSASQVGFELLANGVPVATFTAPTTGNNALNSTGLQDYSLSFSTVSNPQVVGENITVALVYTYTGEYLRNAYFDNVRLTQALEVGAPVPPAPTSLAATPGSGQVSLTWAPVQGATSYDVYEATTSGGEGSTPVATGIDSSSFTVTGLTNGTTYYFVVAAVNTGGVSAVSNETSSTPEASLGIPSAPVLSASSGDMSATLSWAAVSGASTYDIYQATSSGTEGTTPVVTGVTGTTYTITGLADEKTYFFKASAVNTYGTSALSNEVTATPAPPVSGTNAPANFSIYPQVVAANPVPVGFNMQPAAGANITENAWLSDGGFSSYDARMSFTASQDGTATTFVATGGGGTSFYSSITTGYFVGATAYTYRYSSGAWSLLRTDTVSGYTALDDSSAADNTITFASSGPQILAGDITWLDLDNQQSVPSLTLLDPRFTEYCPTWSSETAGCNTRTATMPITLSTDVPPSDTGGTSMEISDSTTETNGIRQYIQGAFNGPSGEEFQPGHTYKVDVWLKQSGISNGSVTFSIDQIGVTHTFTGVTDTWQEFTWTFPAVPGLPANSVQPSAHLDFSAPGTMWVDNFQLYDAAWAPNSISPQVMEAWQNYKPGTVRIWSNFGNNAQNYTYWSLNSWLTPEIKTRNAPGIGNEYEVTGELEHLPDALANVKTIGTANPWLIVNMALSPTEWGELIDYLAAPAGTGYASMRPANHPGPYTTDFKTIYLEVGNEEWGTQQVPADAAYGQWANFVITSAISGKSYYNASQMKFIVNGFELEPGFGSAAIAAAPVASLTEAALYTSGNASLSGDPYYQSDLVQVPVTNAPLINAIVAQQQLDAADGRIYNLAAYEEGSGSDTGDNTLAAAIGAIDTSLYASQSGFGPQNLFMYQLGTGPWSTHTNFANGFIPHPIWEAYQMRNNYATGPIMLTTTNSVPTYSDPTITNGQAVPLISVYTFMDANVANQADVIVISRDLNNQTPVTLNFPATPTGTAQLYTLTGDPRATNNSALVIPIGSEQVTVTSNYTFNMPPGSMYVFQVPMAGAWSASGIPIPPAPATLSASAGNGEVTLSWAASTGATGYNVLRGTTSGGPYTTIGTTAQIAYTDSAVTNGNTYYYVVQATNSGGASGNSPEASAEPNVEDASMTTTAPPLDGSNTGAWAAAPFVPLNHYFDGSSTDTAAYKVLWDSNNLYVLVSVQDSYLIAPTQANIYDGETVELYFSGTDTRSTTYGPTDFQYAFPYGNGGAVVTETYHSPASLTGVQFGQQNITGGYQLAMALPWTTLGTTPVINQQYGFDLMIDTATAEGTLLGKLGWWATVNDTWDNPSLMGPLVLSQSGTQSQTINFAPATPVTYGVAPITLTATGGDSGNPVTFGLVSGPAELSGNSLTIKGAGSVVISANQAGNSSYAAAPQVEKTIVVNKAALTVTANNASSNVGAAIAPLSASYSGFVNGDGSSVLTGSPSLSTTATSSSAAGTYPITATQGTLTAANYTFTYVNGTYSVVAAPTVTLTTSAALSKITNGYQATVTVTNSGNASATGVQLTSATLGTATGTPLPITIGTIAAGSSASVTVTFPSSAGSDGATVVDRFGGTFSGGTFSGSGRATLP
jgi:fibronectin type 3 domain-containing protein